MEQRHATGRHRRRATLGLTLIEGLVASVILAIVAAGASMALGVGVGAQREAQRQLLAGIAAEQQISTVMSAAYADSPTYAGTEATGQMLTPPRPNASGTPVRDSMGAAFSIFGRTTTVTAETRTFGQYNNISVEGYRIRVVVTTADGRVYADLQRYRAKEVEP